MNILKLTNLLYVGILLLKREIFSMQILDLFLEQTGGGRIPSKDIFMYTLCNLDIKSRHLEKLCECTFYVYVRLHNNSLVWCKCVKYIYMVRVICRDLRSKIHQLSLISI